MNIGERIAIRRKELNMTQEELAKKLGYKHKSAINKIEMGINDLSQTKVLLFAEALDTTPAVLMGWRFNDDDDEEETRPTENSEPLTEEEKLIIELFRRVPADDQRKVLAMIRAALE